MTSRNIFFKKIEINYLHELDPFVDSAKEMRQTCLLDHC